MRGRLHRWVGRWFDRQSSNLAVWIKDARLRLIALTVVVSVVAISISPLVSIGEEWGTPKRPLDYLGYPGLFWAILWWSVFYAGPWLYRKLWHIMCVGIGIMLKGVLLEEGALQTDKWAFACFAPIFISASVSSLWAIIVEPVASVPPAKASSWVITMFTFGATWLALPAISLILLPRPLLFVFRVVRRAWLRWWWVKVRHNARPYDSRLWGN